MAKKLPVSQSKAREIMKDGTVHGHPLTQKQRGLFGAIAGGSALNKWHHSPDSYEDAGSPDGPSKIHYSATPENVHKSATPKSAGGIPDKVQANDPASSPRANTTVKSASVPDSPSGGKTRWGGVDSYPESAKETV